MSLATPENIRRFQRKLYVKAKEAPDFRFYSLYDKVCREDILFHAYLLARSNRGAAGVDRINFEDIEARSLGEWLSCLRKELRDGTYMPEPVRRVMLAKPDGGERPLGIPTIRDRVVQTALKLVLEPIFEADFDPCAYGYRPKRSAQGAVREVHRLLRAGYTDVVDADLSRYFDTIPHDQLMRSVARRVVDRRVLKLVKAFLKAPVEERDDRGNPRMTGGKRATCGTPQGGVLSPLLANIYMHRFLRAWRQQGKGAEFQAHVINYADDMVILSRGCAAEGLAWTRRVMTAIGLQLNDTKTSLRDARKETFDFLGYTFGSARSRRTGRWYQSVSPSKKSVQRIKLKIRQQLLPANVQPWPEVVDKLNRMQRGWANYFNIGAGLGAHRALQHHVLERVRHFLRRRHKVTTHGNRRFSRSSIFGQYEVVDMMALYRGRPPCAST